MQLRLFGLDSALSWELKTTEVDFFLYTHFDMHISGREESIFRSMIITNKLGSHFLEGVRRRRGKNLILNSWPAEHLLIDFWQDEILTSGTEIFKLKSVKFNYFLIKIQHFKLEMKQVLNSIPFSECKGGTDVPTEPTLLSKWALHFSATQAGGCVRSWLPLI